MTNSSTIAIASVQPPLPPNTPIDLLHSHRHALATCFTYFNLEELIAHSIVCQCWYRTTTDPIVWTHSTHLVWNTGTFIPLRFHQLVRVVRLQFMDHNLLMLQGRAHRVHERSLVGLINCTDITLTQIQLPHTNEPIPEAALSLFGLLPPSHAPTLQLLSPHESQSNSSSYQTTPPLRPIRRLTIQRWSVLTSSLDPAPFFQHPRMQLLEELTITFQPAPHFWNHIPQLVYLRCVRLGRVQFDISGILGELYENQLAQGLPPIDALDFQEITPFNDSQPNQQTGHSLLTRPFPLSITRMAIRDVTSFSPATVELFKPLTQLQVLTMQLWCQPIEPLANFLRLLTSFQGLRSLTLTFHFSANFENLLECQYALNVLLHHNKSDLVVTSLIIGTDSVNKRSTPIKLVMTKRTRTVLEEALSTATALAFTSYPLYATYLRKCHAPLFSSGSSLIGSDSLDVLSLHLPTLTNSLTELDLHSIRFHPTFLTAIQQLPSINLTNLRLQMKATMSHEDLHQLYIGIGRQTQLKSLQLDVNVYDYVVNAISASDPIEANLALCCELIEINFAFKFPCSIGLATIVSQLPKLRTLKYGSMMGEVIPVECLAVLLKSSSLNALHLLHQDDAPEEADDGPSPYDLGAFLSEVTVDSSDQQNRMAVMDLLIAHPHIRTLVNYVTPEVYRQSQQQIKQKWSE